MSTGNNSETPQITSAERERMVRQAAKMSAFSILKIIEKC